MSSMSDYLKKYLSKEEGGDSGKKKRKKAKLKTSRSNFTILDDDVAWQTIAPKDEDREEDPDDAPLVAEFCDEQDEILNPKWCPLQHGETDHKEPKGFEVLGSSDLSPPRRQKDSDLSPPRGRHRSPDLSPPRRGRRPDLKLQTKASSKGTGSPHSDPPDISPPRRRKQYDMNPHGEDTSMKRNSSPPRRKRYISPDLSPPRSRIRLDSKSDDDLSPPRRLKSKPGVARRARHDSLDRLKKSLEVRRKTPNQTPVSDSIKKIPDLHEVRRQIPESSLPRPKEHDSPDSSPPRRKRHDSPDSSPPRRKKRHDSPDASPPRRKKRHDSPDSSPPRRKKGHDSPDPSSPRRKKRRDLPDSSPPRRKKRHDSPDPSPPRQKKRHDSPDSSPPRRKKRHDSPDSSPPRRKKRHDSPDSSPPRRKRHDSPDSSPPRRKRHDSPDFDSPRINHDLSLPRRTGSKDVAQGVVKGGRDSKGELRMTSGARSGLQSADILKEENIRARERQEAFYKEMDTELSGRHAETVRRDKEGKKIDPQLEKVQKRKEEMKKMAEDEKFMEWGRGVAQVRMAHEKVADELYEMSKPLARYADDEDLERMLKEREREGDPMLAFIKKKKTKAAASSGETAKQGKPTYKGPFPANRFGIRPGYRWDGVDRSNGFEKALFARESNRKAIAEESYKWSVEDM